MSQLNVNSIKDRTGENQPDIIGAAKAFVNFNGTGVVAIRDSFNVSGITDNAAGNYTINYDNPLEDTNYCVAGSCTWNDGGSGQGSIGFPSNTEYSTTQTRVYTYNGLGSAFATFDSPKVSLIVF